MDKVDNWLQFMIGASQKPPTCSVAAIYGVRHLLIKNIKLDDVTSGLGAFKTQDFKLARRRWTDRLDIWHLDTRGQE